MRKLKIRRKEKRREERRRRKGLSLFLFPPPFVFRIFLFFYYFHLFFVQRQGELSTCFNILKTLLVFHPLPVETLFRGVACAMLRVAFTGHVSPLPLPLPLSLSSSSSSSSSPLPCVLHISKRSIWLMKTFFCVHDRDVQCNVHATTFPARFSAFPWTHVKTTENRRRFNYIISKKKKRENVLTGI